MKLSLFRIDLEFKTKQNKSVYRQEKNLNH